MTDDPDTRHSLTAPAGAIRPAYAPAAEGDREAVDARAGESAPAVDFRVPGRSVHADEAIAAEIAHPGAESDAEEPDIGFRLEDAPVDPAEQARVLSHRIARAILVDAPQGWVRLEAVFAVTVAAQTAQVVFSDGGDRVLRVQPSEEVGALVLEQRLASAGLGDGPWWRMLIRLSNTGDIEVDYDYGAVPFPEDQLFVPAAYQADLEAFPRERVPVWLAAYIGHAGRQLREPKQAAVQARSDRAAGRRGVVADHEFPEFPLMWARWAVVAAAFVAVESPWGPRIRPAEAWFEGRSRSGSTLYVLPGQRAVLSGGVWDAPELASAYNTGGILPELYAGAPEWVANPVLNPRAGTGTLSFCYWWADGHWYRGDSPGQVALAPAVPGMWSTATVVDLIAGLAYPEPEDADRRAVATLVAAAEIGVATRDTLADVFGDDGSRDLDSAWYQLVLAGVASSAPNPLPRTVALEQVRTYLLESGFDTTGYDPAELIADRVAVGWMVFVPTRPGEIAIDRAIFYVADDGVLEQSSSATDPAVFAERFAARYFERAAAQ